MYELGYDFQCMHVQEMTWLTVLTVRMLEARWLKAMTAKSALTIIAIQYA